MCPANALCPSPDPNGSPGSSSSPGSGPSDNPTGGPSDNPSGGPSSSPGSSSSPEPDPNASPTPDGNGDCPGDGYVADGQSCVYCPKNYFGYSRADGCFIEAKLGIEHHPTVPSGAPVNPPVFSPRDLNDYLDQLDFSLTEKDTHALTHAAWQMRIVPKTGPLVGDDDFDGGNKLKFDAQGDPLQGDQMIVYNGWDETQSCLIDGQYLLTAESDPFVFVPGYGLPVPSRLKLLSASNQPLVKLPGATASDPANAMEFWVDNTPPIVKDVVITPEQVSTDPEPKRYETTVVFTVKEPEVYGVQSKLNMESDKFKLYIQAAPFYTPPEFSIAALSEPLASDRYTLTTSPDHKSATVSFKVPYLLTGYTVEASVTDSVENQGHYVIYPKGGNF